MRWPRLLSAERREAQPEAPVERRESQPFTDAIAAAIFAQASGGALGDYSAIGALECAAGLWSRAFAAATVNHPAVTPAVMSLIGRDLVRRGESLFLIEIEAGAPVLRPVGSWDVRGDWRETAWWYRVDLFGPSGNITRFRPSGEIVHCRYAVDPSRPWHGLGPLQWARQTGTLAANAERRLSEEASGAVARLLPVPQDPGEDDDDDMLAGVRMHIADGRGRAALVESTRTMTGEGPSAVPAEDWKQRRIGPDPPLPFVQLRSDAALAVLDACGVPRALAESADGTAAREGWRRFVMGSVEPIARTVAGELAAKLDAPGLTFDFAPLWAHDLAGRAQSFKAMVTAGMAVAEAASLSGLAVEDAA